MFVIISIPHQSKVSSQSWETEKDFIQDMEWESNFEVKNFSDALEHYTHDLYGSIVIRTKSDLGEALNYPFTEHKGLEVRREAESVKEASYGYFV